jgi:hypothetical protein
MRNGLPSIVVNNVNRNFSALFTGAVTHFQCDIVNYVIVE